MSSFSMASLSVWICVFSWLPSLDVTEHEMTGRLRQGSDPSPVCVRTRV